MGRMTPVVVGVTFLAGCAQLAGIDETSGPGTPDLATLSVERVSVGSAIVIGPQDLSASMAQYLLPDEMRADAPLVANDTWGADVPGAPPVLFDLPDKPDPKKRLLDLGARNGFMSFAVLEHPNPEPPPGTAMLTVTSTLPSGFDAATESLQVYIVGAWAQRAIPTAEEPVLMATAFGPVTFAYGAMTAITTHPLEKITTADAVLLLRYTSPGNHLSGVMEAVPFEQTGSDMVMGTMTAVPASETLDFMVGPPATVAARFAPARPAVPNLSMVWQLHAAPGATYAVDNGPLLTQGSIGMADTGAVTATYGNPFVAKGWPTTLTWQATASRSYTPDGQTLPATLQAGLQQIEAPTSGQMLDFPAGLPEAVSIDGLPLSADGVEIPKPTAAVNVTFVSAIQNNTLYAVNLYELVPNAGGTALVHELRIAALASTPAVALPPELFETGKLYVLRAFCIQGGFPKAAEGDLRVRSLPYSHGFLDSGVFTVMP
jgi:hypothetical protein